MLRLSLFTVIHRQRVLRLDVDRLKPLRADHACAFRRLVLIMVRLSTNLSSLLHDIGQSLGAGELQDATCAWDLASHPPGNEHVNRLIIRAPNGCV